MLGQKQELEKELADKQKLSQPASRKWPTIWLRKNAMLLPARWLKTSRPWLKSPTASEETASYLASLLAGEVIGRTLDLASNDRFPKMLKLAQDYLEILTGGRYGKSFCRPKLSKKTPLKVVRKDKKKIPLAYLSGGPRSSSILP